MSRSPDKHIAGQKGEQDRFLSAQSQYFDGYVAENTDKRGGWRGMKYERPSFVVVTASEAYRAGYDEINWGKENNDHVEVTQKHLGSGS